MPQMCSRAYKGAPLIPPAQVAPDVQQGRRDAQCTLLAATLLVQHSPHALIPHHVARAPMLGGRAGGAGGGSTSASVMWLVTTSLSAIGAAGAYALAATSALAESASTLAS